MSMRTFAKSRSIGTIIRATRTGKMGIVTSGRSFRGAPTGRRVMSHLEGVRSLKTSVPGVTIVPRGAGSILALLTTARRVTERCTSHPVVAVSVSKANIVDHLYKRIFNSTLAFKTIKGMSTPKRVKVRSLAAMVKLLRGDLWVEVDGEEGKRCFSM